LTPCPHCGASTERGQLVCVECGNRLALKEEGRERRPLDNLPAIAVLLAVVVIGAGAFGFALSEITDDSGNSSAAADDTKAESSPPPTTETDTGKAQRPSHSLLLTWPKGLTAYTVVLLSTGDRPGAQRVARQAARSGLEAGLLRSDDFNLGQGYWIVFAGRFDTQASAEQQASNLASRYPGAYATQVKPSG
jgi:predicted nucleic acid-binding Zn ribbon protein